VSEESYGRVTARYYDLAYGGRPELAHDGAFYLSLAREAAGPVLELGCGTGRVLLAIATAGFPCTGLDDSQAMLSALRAKRPPPTLRLVRAPMQDFDLGGDRFSLIYSAFRAFQHLCTVEDQLACLACVRRHLTPGGVFAFDVFNPRLERIALREEPESEDVRFAEGGDEVVRHVSVSRDPGAQVQRVRMRYGRRSAGAGAGEDRVEFSMRWFYRFEIEHLLARAGFELAALYGDFDRSPFSGASPAIIAVAR
jgi:SAM-dependent methyltransferase